VAVFALSAVTASAASAFTKFVSNPGEQIITAGQTKEHKFTVGGGGTVTCKEANFEDISKIKEAASAKFKATYGKCSAFTGEAFVRMHGCEYEMFANETVSVVNCHAITGQEDAEKNAATEIEIEVPSLKCKVWVGKQGPMKKVKYANVTGKNGRKSVEAKIEVKEELTAWSSGGGFGCPTKGEHKKGSYEGVSVAEGQGTNGTVEVI
jgi:hypothetical protein